jgi:hypothetical protein
VITGVTSTKVGVALQISISTDPACAQAIVTATASDPDGTVTAVDLWYQPYQTASQPVAPVDVAMKQVPGAGWQGTTHGGTWPFPALAVAYRVPYWVIVTDNQGAQTKITSTQWVIIEASTCG